MNNQPIGILDSGVGGLSIWKEIVSSLPSESTIYIGDSKNCPYGSKSSEEIYVLASKMIKFLLSKNVKLIVIACNTITVTSLTKLRSDFKNIPILGIVPVIKTAAEKTKNGKIGVLSTVQTAKSNYQKKLIEKFAKDLKVINIGTDKLVPFVEKGELDSENLKIILKKILMPFIKSGIDVLALGCSHFPFLKKQMQEILGKNVNILDSAGAVARQIERVLLANKTKANSPSVSHKLFTTERVDLFKNTYKKLISGKIAVEIAYARL